MTTMEELKRRSFLCEENMLLIDKFGKGVTELAILKGITNAYNTCNGILVFYDENGRVYVTKWSQESDRIVNNNNYTRICLEVPFSDGATPVDPNYARQLRKIIK